MYCNAKPISVLGENYCKGHVREVSVLCLTGRCEVYIVSDTMCEWRANFNNYNGMLGTADQRSAVLYSSEEMVLLKFKKKKLKKNRYTSLT